MFTSEDYEQLYLMRSGQKLELRLWKALSGEARRRGLLGTEDLPADCALLLTRAPVVHMVGMRYSLDLAFLNSKGEIIRIVERAKPGLRLYGSWRAKQCLEMASGRSKELGLETGQRLETPPIDVETS